MKNTNYLKEELYELIKTDESIFDFIQESSLDGLWYWDLERSEEEWMNPKFWAVLGYDYREMPHKASAWKDIIYPEDLKLATENFIKHCENPAHPYDQTVRYTHKKGSTVWIRCRGLAIRDKHGKPLRMLGAHQDITEIKNNELLLQMKTDQLRNAQQISKVGSWELDLKTNKVVWTEELYKMYGFDPALPPPLYTEQMKLFTPESWQILTSSVAISKEQGIPYELELRTIRKDGGHGWMWVRGEAVFDENKNITGLRGVTQDISEKKILELEKEALIKRLNYALDASGDGIWDWTPSNGITVFSKAWIEMLGYKVGELASLASEWSDRLHPDDVEWVFAAINKVTQTPENGDSFSHEYRFKNKAGDYLWILNKAKVVERNEQGEAIRVVGTHTNITKEKETRRQIEEAKQQAEAASKAKSEFLANMSHEIRTPMNAVLGMLQLIKTTELSKQQDDYTSKAQIAAKSLLNLINDILDYSKVEAGKLELECHPFQLDELMRELAVVLSPNLGKKNVELLFDIDTALPSVIRGDRLRLQQILVNLAGNAIKFTDVGEVVVQLQQLKIQNNICQMRVSVKDTGIGISHEQQQRIFDSFTQAEASTARKYGGSGLGLVISKQMIHLMGGELQLTSEVGSGSCFWFDVGLPIEVNPTLEDTTHYSIGSDINVLIVDDNEAALEVLARSVEQFGATVFKASSGDEALMQFTQCMEKKQTIHAVLMDYRMPGMDGLTAAREIKNRAGIDQVPMIVMVSAFGREEIIHAQQTGNSAFESYLTKPVTAKQLYNLLKRAIAGDEMALSTRILPTQSKLRLQGVHLLLVEDNEFNRLVATELLKNEGATVDVAIGGQEGVDAVLSDVTQYDLVLMDVQMSGIDGLEATKRIRAKSGFAQLPIIAMTANVYLSDQEACLQAGMNAHLSKPLDLEKIIECILHFVKPANVLVPEQQNVIAEVKDDTGADHKTLTSILKRFGGNATFFRRLITRFETNFEQQLLSLQDIVDEKDWDGLLALLHAIKGTSGTVGLSSLYQKVCELETEFKLAHGRTDGSCETLSVGLVSNLRQLAMSELSDIHRLLATSPE